MTTLDDELAVKTAPARAPKGRKHAPSKKRKGFKAWLRRWWWVFVVVPLVAVIGLLLTLFYVYSQLELPKTPPPLQTTYIYDREGNQIATLHSTVDRTIIPLSDMPLQLQHAVIAVEDKGFYEHPGIDVTGVFRAAWTDLVSGEIVQGGSTLTQQLVKNVYAGQYSEDPKTGVETYVVPPRTLGQKVRESLLAIKVEREFTKDEILAKYLNTVYFGRGAYGVQAAAQTFFQKDASELSALESALLAGMVQSPSFYDPVEHEPEAKERRDYVLEQMASEGYLTAERAAQLEARPVKVNPIEVGLNFPGKLGYFLDYTRRDLISTGTAEGQVFGGGLQVTTTLDPQMQRYAEEAVANRLPTPGDPAAAVVAIDPRNGAVRAMYGGKNFAISKVNLATGDGGSGRQAGSAFKPFTLATAMEQGYSLNDALARPGLDHDPGPRVLHGRRALGALERGGRGERRLHAAAGDRVLGEHRLRAGRVRRDARGDRGDGPPDGDPVAARARVLDHARDAGGHAARDDERVRDARGSRVAAPGLAARAGRPRGRQDRPADRRRGASWSCGRTTPTS